MASNLWRLAINAKLVRSTHGGGERRGVRMTISDASARPLRASHIKGSDGDPNMPLQHAPSCTNGTLGQSPDMLYT